VPVQQLRSVDTACLGTYALVAASGCGMRFVWQAVCAYVPCWFSALLAVWLQAEAMIKGYRTAILLIEFDGDKTFALTGHSEVAVELDSRSPQARLVLLLLHFPKLRCAQGTSSCTFGSCACPDGPAVTCTSYRAA
jgi:hypothetical protein